MVLEFLNKILPAQIWNIGRDIHHSRLKKKYLKGERPANPGETTKAKQRRLKEDFFNKYCNGFGLDIGFGGDPVTPTVQGWDFEHGDAQYLQTLSDSQFDFVYSSHTLEHMIDPKVALKNWWRVLKPGGYLIIYLPHRDLYEKKKNLPSRFNTNHTHFFLIDEEDLPDTLSLKKLIEENLIDQKIVYIKECSEGYKSNGTENHSSGEYSIEAVIQKI